MPPRSSYDGVFDVVVVGGGIIGVATAYALLNRRPGLRIAILEKEGRLAAHQTGHNSGVIHSGIYYKPGSMKARTCAEGRRALLRFCDEHKIAYELCGKVIVATLEGEVPRLQELQRRADANGVPVERIGSGRLQELEPYAEGVQALHVPGAGIVDFARVVRTLADEVRKRGAEIRLRQALTDVSRDGGGLRVATTDRVLGTRWLVNAAGLHSDRIARLCGADPQARIVPFRGEYYELLPQSRHLVRNLVYPVPDPSFPFLGVHFTRMLDGNVHAGPNAVLALSREGYRWSTVRARDIGEVLSFGGFWRLAQQHYRTGAGEVYRSLSKRAFVRALRRLVPQLGEEDLVPSGAGVRAQAVGTDGRMLDDFCIAESACAVHIVNAPSPAATASLQIGAVVAARLLERVAESRFGADGAWGRTG